MEPLVVRHPSNRTYAVVVWVLAAVFAVSFLVDGGPGELVRLGVHPLAVAAIAWVVLWRPHVVLDDDAVTVANVLRSVRVPYRAVRAVGVRWGLRIEADGGRWDAWAVPARSAPARIGRAARTGLRQAGGWSAVRHDDPGPGRETWDAPTVAGLVEEHVREHRTGRVEAASGVEDRPRTWTNTREAVVLAAAVLLSAGALVLG